MSRIAGVEALARMVGSARLLRRGRSFFGEALSCSHTDKYVGGSQDADSSLTAFPTQHAADMWWCHACSAHFQTSLDVNASEVCCNTCGEVRVAAAAPAAAAAAANSLPGALLRLAFEARAARSRHTHTQTHPIPTRLPSSAAHTRRRSSSSTHTQSRPAAATTTTTTTTMTTTTSTTTTSTTTSAARS